MMSNDIVPLIEEAAARVYSVVKETPLAPLAGIPGGSSGLAFAKLEQLQTTGSFKLRGATNKLMSLTPAAASAGVITSSTGNHGLGVATAANLLGIDAEVFLSEQVTAPSATRFVSAARGSASSGRIRWRRKSRRARRPANPGEPTSLRITILTWWRGKAPSRSS